MNLLLWTHNMHVSFAGHVYHMHSSKCVANRCYTPCFWHATQPYACCACKSIFFVYEDTGECCALLCTMHTLWICITVFPVQVLEAILDDDQDMQDMYLARRAEMADMIAPDPDNPPDNSADPALALLPSGSSSSFAETALTQALQNVASTQEQQPASPQYLVSKHAGQSWHSQRADQEQRQDLEDGLSPRASRHPLDMAVPDQASFLSLDHIKAHCRFTHATMGQITMRMYLLPFLPFLQSVLTLSKQYGSHLTHLQTVPFPEP